MTHIEMGFVGVKFWPSGKAANTPDRGSNGPYAAGTTESWGAHDNKAGPVCETFATQQAADMGVGRSQHLKVWATTQWFGGFYVGTESTHICANGLGVKGPNVKTGLWFLDTVYLDTIFQGHINRGNMDSLS